MISADSGPLAEWAAANDVVATRIKSVEVDAGETIDFVVESGPTLDFDTFEWPLTLSLSTTDGRETFDSVADFSTDQQVGGAVPLTAWEKYVQVLLCSNEFFFVD